jgi:hypothetical protein
MKIWTTLVLALFLGASAPYSAYGIEPGVSGQGDVLSVMWQPAVQQQVLYEEVAFARGSRGYFSFGIHIGLGGRLRPVEEALDEKIFTRIQAGMTKEEVLRILGPSDPWGTNYFKARDELAWEWPYCDLWREEAYFIVLFDGTRGIVRSTMSLDETADPIPC